MKVGMAVVQVAGKDEGERMSAAGVGDVRFCSMSPVELPPIMKDCY